MSLRLLLLLLALSPALRAAGPDDKLVGEDNAAPTAVPTPAGDERGPVQVTRKAQVAPSFDLPAFVVTGSGERQALARRQELGGALDTSGGLKTSPGEQGAGKDQLEAQGGRESLEEVSATSKPFLGAVHLLGSYYPGYDAGGYLAQQLGAWSWSAEASRLADHGSEKQSELRGDPISAKQGFALRGGWRGEDGKAANLFVKGASAERHPEPYAAGAVGALLRSQVEAGFDAEEEGAKGGWRAQLRGGQASGAFTGLELSEDFASLDLALRRRFSGRTGSALLVLDLGVDNSSQAWLGGRRTIQLYRAALTSHFDAFGGTHLGLGLGLDAAAGDDSALQLGPRLQWDQRLGAGLSLNASLSSGLKLSRLRDYRAMDPWFTPDPSLKPARLALDGAADLNWRAAPALALSAGAFVQQGEDWFLPQSSATSLLTFDRGVRGWRLQGLRAGGHWQGEAWSADLRANWRWASLPDLPDQPTYVLPWNARGAVGYKSGPWTAELSLNCLGLAQAEPNGLVPMGPTYDLGAELRWAYDEAWTVYAQGRNLADQPQLAEPGYPDASPQAGLGVEYRF